MIYNPFLERLLAVVGVQEISLIQERELSEILLEHHSSRIDKDSASYASGYDDGYHDAETEHEDDWDDGKKEGEEDVWNFLGRRCIRKIEECDSNALMSEEDKIFYNSLKEWLEDAKIDY